MDTWIWPAFPASLWFISWRHRRTLNIMNRMNPCKYAITCQGHPESLRFRFDSIAGTLGCLFLTMKHKRVVSVNARKLKPRVQFIGTTRVCFMISGHNQMLRLLSAMLSENARNTLIYIMVSYGFDFKVQNQFSSCWMMKKQLPVIHCDVMHCV